VRDRAKQFAELDVLNEALRNRSYWNVFGPAGIADIHNECARVLADAGGDALLYTNEYNVFQWSFDRDAGGKDVADPYANWYRREVEDLRNAGGAVTGIGVQYYADISAAAQKDGPHSAARILQALNTLAVSGLPIELTEFGVQRGRDKTGDPILAAQALEETMRITFGTDQAKGFIVWGFRMPWLWEKADVGALLDADWTPTPAGERFLSLLSKWDTDLSVNADAGAKVHFTGYFGDYELTAGGKTFPLKLVRGKTEYAIESAAPPAASAATAR
jgi:GH35 family endo-1,4-beta-xylanase